MIQRLTITQQYAKYLENIKSCDDAQVISNFNKLESFLANLFNTQAEDEELLTHIKLDSINMTLKEIRKRSIKLKNAASYWDSKEIGRFFNLLDKANAIYNNLKEHQEGSSEEYIAVEGVLINCINEQKDPSVKLYMYLKHEDSAEGRNLYKSSSNTAKQLIAASSEEEIDVILQEVNNPQQTKPNPSTRFKYASSIPKIKLFELFNPQTLEEAEQCYSKLEDMVDNGEINYEDYQYVKDILLSRNTQKYINLQEIKIKQAEEAKKGKKSSSMPLTVIYGDKWEAEYDAKLEAACEEA